jgi:hypothetical protein
MLDRRHLLALAPLLGWILMVPPFQFSGDTPRANLDAPLSQWSQVRTFNRDSDCEAARSDYQRKPTGNLVIMLGQKQAQAVTNAAVCVSSDDPRLKLK